MCATAGTVLERDTLLGRVFSLGPQRGDFAVPAALVDGSSSGGTVDLITELAQLPKAGIGDEASSEEEEDGMAAALAASLMGPGGAAGATGFGVAGLLPLALAVPAVAPSRRTAVVKVLQEVRSNLRTGAATHRALLRSVLDVLLMKGGAPARAAVFDWVGAVLDANAERTRMVFTHLHDTPAVSSLSSVGLLSNIAVCMMGLCDKFWEPTDPKAGRIDVRYFSSVVPNGDGGGRFHTHRADRLAPFIDYASGTFAEGASDAAEPPSWVDARNRTKQEQFARYREAQLKRALAAAGGTPGEGTSASVSSAVGPEVTPLRATGSGFGDNVSAPAAGSFIGSPDPLSRAPTPAGPVAFSNIAEMFGLAMRALHVAAITAIHRMDQGRRMSARMAEQRDDFAAALVRSGTAIHSGDVINRYGRFLDLSDQLVSMQASRQMNTVWLEDDKVYTAMMSQYRLLATTLVRCVVPGFQQFVGGAGPDVEYFARAGGAGSATPTFLPLPSDPRLPLPPPSAVVCGLPAHLVSDPADFFLMLRRSADKAVRTYLFARMPVEVATDILTFLTVFIASPLHVHNPYTRSRLVMVSLPWRLGRWVGVGEGLCNWQWLQSPALAPRQMVVNYVPFRDAPYRQGPEFAGRAVIPMLHTLLRSHPLAIRALAPAITEFHVDIGHTGSHAVRWGELMGRGRGGLSWCGVLFM